MKKYEVFTHQGLVEVNGETSSIDTEGRLVIGIKPDQTIAVFNQWNMYLIKLGKENEIP